MKTKENQFNFHTKKKLILNIYHNPEEIIGLALSAKGPTSHPVLQKNVAKTKDKIAINLTKIFKLGPLVSFNGSPTVSPTTAALCSSVPFLF